MAFQILADAAKSNIDILETIQLLAQGRKENLVRVVKFELLLI